MGGLIKFECEGAFLERLFIKAVLFPDEWRYYYPGVTLFFWAVFTVWTVINWSPIRRLFIYLTAFLAS